MTKKTVIRVGDKVRVLRDRFIDRVGYALHFSMLVDEVEADPRTEAALRALGVQIKHGSLPRGFVDEVARLRVRQRGFGGPERRIHYQPEGGYAHWVGCTLEVYGKRIAKTGDYYPPSGGVSHDGEEYYESGGLENAKTHIILSTTAGEIEACDVELVR